ncbi:hypothetical protein A4U49_04365 [Acidithiobacillus ferrivorans]|uniref:DUF7146 domain-containing protein n=1 Tax=Acidithiobacillus ferrivorans TaxID=160808 RepID=UPI000893440B|nr:primase-helicase zinc-binding domain-containing protein [Acidithiobacillus ferrivorans]OFA17021.1 hypothetical protein A4U49_04365 [Acidithiobacillus ferrivorans]
MAFASIELNQRESLYGQVKDRLPGLWPEVLTRLGIPDSALHNKNCPCPGCGGKDRFRFDNKEGQGTFVCSQGNGQILAGNGWKLLEHVYGWDFHRALPEVAHVLGLGVDADMRFPRPAVIRRPIILLPVNTLAQQNAEAQRLEQARSSLQKLQSSVMPISSVPTVMTYLRGRGLTDEITIRAKNLFAHPALPYYVCRDSGQFECLGNFPAMVAWCQNGQGEIIAAHRTYLNEQGGKLCLQDPDHPERVLPFRKLSTPIRPNQSYAIHLFNPLKNGTLGVAEGIENAFSAILLHKLPVISGINADMLGKLILPGGVSRLAIFGDNDPAGRKGVETLMIRTKEERPEIYVKTIYPQQISPSHTRKSDDWNDNLIQTQPNTERSFSR